MDVIFKPYKNIKGEMRIVGNGLEDTCYYYIEYAVDVQSFAYRVLKSEVFSC